MKTETDELAEPDSGGGVVTQQRPEQRNRIDIHPAATLLPSPSPEEYERLKEDIRKNGLRVPVVLTADDRILDGRSRVRACTELGIPYATRVATVDEMLDPDALVLSLNVHRRHLLVGQVDRILATYITKNATKIEADREAAKVARQAGLQRGTVRGVDGHLTGKTSAKIAKDTGMPEDAVKRMLKVKKVAPDRLEDVAAGKASAAEILKQELPENKPIVTKKQNKVRPPATEQPTPKKYKAGSPKWVEEQVQAIYEASFNLQSVYPRLTGGQYGQQERIRRAQRALEHVMRIGANFARVNQVSLEVAQLWNQQASKQVEGERDMMRSVKEAVAHVPYIRPWKQALDKIYAAQGSSWFTSEHFEWLTDIRDESELEELEKEWASASPESVEGVTP